MVGVQELTLEEDRQMHISDTASNSIIIDGSKQAFGSGKFLIS